MTNRFDVIVDCNGSTDLIDKTNELTTIPLGFNLTSHFPPSVVMPVDRPAGPGFR